MLVLGWSEPDFAVSLLPCRFTMKARWRRLFFLKLCIRVKDNNNSTHGKFHQFLFPFSSKFSDLNFTSYVLYIYPCNVMWHAVSLGSTSDVIWFPGWEETGDLCVIFNQRVNQSVSLLVNQWNNQWISQSFSQLVCKSDTQSIHHSVSGYRPPCYQEFSPPMNLPPS